MFASAVRRAQTPPNAPQDGVQSHMRPVSREQRMQRLAQRGADAGMGSPAAPEHPNERLKRAGRAIDEWSASRSEKSLWQSWMCAYVLTSHSAAHAHCVWTWPGCILYLRPLCI